MAPIGISFGDQAPAGVAAFAEPMSEPAADGRAGRVAAGCVFWVRAAEQQLHDRARGPRQLLGGPVHPRARQPRGRRAATTTWPPCSNRDGSTPEAVGGIPSISERSEVITYGPVAESATTPDVVLLRVNGRQMMVLSDALPGLKIEGKPQCHIVALAKEHGEVAASVGCALSRARTGMRPDEMTLALPGSRLAEVTDAVQRTAAIDTVVAKYAADDARRFASAS